MKLRPFLLLWPLLMSAPAAMTTAWLAGPSYTTALNQGSLVIQGLGLMAWVLVALVSAGMTPIVLKMKTVEEWVISSFASLGSVALFHAVCTRMD